MEIKDRLKEPIPTFWKKIQRIGLAVGAIGTAIITAPVSLPTIVLTVGGYLATAGVVSTVLTQLTSTER